MKNKTDMKKLFTVFTLLSTLTGGLSSTYAQNFIKVTRTNDEQTINLSNNQILEIQLPRQASTGYVWCEAKNATGKTIPKTVEQIGNSDFICDPFPANLIIKKGRMVGGSGTQLIRYVGASQGTTLLTLELRRPWLKNSEAIDSYSINIVSEGKYTGFYTSSDKAIRKNDMVDSKNSGIMENWKIGILGKPASFHYSIFPIMQTNNAIGIFGTLHKSLTSTKSTLPSSWDWRSECTPIKDQGNCADCWAYASVGDLECNILIHDGITVDISEEFVTDCYIDNNCFGCIGGNCANQAWLGYFTGANADGGGAVYENENPTTCNGTGVTGICTAPYLPHQTIDGYADIGGENANGVPSVDSIKFRIYYDGPVYVGVACENWESQYTGGIWVENSATAADVNHAVCLVGWKDTTVNDNSGGYWILRNSWGTGFGINGYMYISYGSDLVGTGADYIVYKGGTPHNSPPVVIFTASKNATCSSNSIQFTDNSVNLPTSWLWTFGDGGTSTLQNPTHTYAANGTFTVSLTASNMYGSNTSTQIDYISIDMPAPPSVIGGSCAGAPCSVTLNASCVGLPDCSVNWYDASTGGTLLYTGTSYTTPVLNTTTTYYVQNVVGQVSQFGGMIAPTANGGYYNGTDDYGLVFDALSDININGVMIYADSTNTKRIWLKNSSGVILDSLITSSTGEQTLSLDFNVPEGTGYVLGADGGCKLWKDDHGASFPHTMPGLVFFRGVTSSSKSVSIPISTAYCYFYNWQVGPPPCLSAMVPVTATVTVGINELSDSYNIMVNPNPAMDKITIEAPQNKVNNSYRIEISNIEGQIIKTFNITNKETTIDVSGLSGGVYFIKAQSDKGVVIHKFIKQ